MLLPPQLQVAEETWGFDDVEWWILRRHWAGAGPQHEAMMILFGTGGELAGEGLHVLDRFIASLSAQRNKPLVVGTDKYPGVSDWNRRWRELLQKSGTAFESMNPKGRAVFRGKSNLTKTEPSAQPDIHAALAPFASALSKLEAASKHAHVVGSLRVSLSTTYEGL